MLQLRGADNLQPKILRDPTEEITPWFKIFATQIYQIRPDTTVTVSEE